ncbi:DNA/pantothenate metabolism flavoprotein [Pseudothermotoga hypogea DSM 11164 = NBRC 106472]|uniref:Coenzyme A biosynthesis bifunctional protein CoaBC n=1 Tax=Pseudothermotoga hypogea DSM 11164 = NBRC 106472 TaxID=1123384 RepID=A0A0X1KPC8_9THEM|nr:MULTISPECIES: bifunctional phosphopantothenoylcysteine decarboxylase/phosphopantothenate--cysteine ligase CoaBC [Pseudothermotoga]AJC73064.1 DNA/pantothenate metabolism flavoprotein [Pseudothermotoga hypogea DSM 11164 = NBRC 106472]MDI6861783.1 bifunctional phosphopantothenoylcysteine decarboxylase/phosphopantothenate--cysteine ligase CoaBC [Pseudothermotoga sp.]
MKVLVGVTGCIALYKVLGLVSSLRKDGHELRIIMTESAQKLVSKDLFSAVGNCPVYTDEDAFNIKDGWIPHTELSRWPDVFVVAPATANTIAKIAHGVADNLLTMVSLAFAKDKRLLVPAMNVRMFENPITQENIEKLRRMGWWVLDPAEGHLACGEMGRGRYPENEVVQEAIYILGSDKPLRDLRLLVTAGPTWESIDPVRVITNRSSGKMGFEIARMAARLGAEVTLIAGPTCLRPPFFIKEYVSIESAQQMFEETMKRFESVDGVIMAAAVADYTPALKSSSKLKKSEERLSIELIKTKDILEELGRKKSKQILVGFAVETEELETYAEQKLRKKNLDMIVANEVQAMGSDQNTVTIIKRDGSKKRVGPDAKDRIALAILDELAHLWRGS